MAYNIGEVCAAPALQSMLDDHFRICKPHNRPFDVGTLMFLRSGVNMDTAMQSQLTTNTQRRTVQVIWMQRQQKSDTSTSCTQSCTGGEEEGTNCTDYLITECLSRKWTVTPSDWELSQEPVGVWAPKLLQSHINALTGRLNEEVVIDIEANFGDFASLNGTGPFVTQTSCPTTLLTETSHHMIEDVMFESLDSGFCTLPYVIGWGEAYKYMQRVRAGCCTDPNGLNIDTFRAQNGFTFIPDRTIEEQVGVDHFISLDTGAVQVFTWNAFQGDLRQVVDNSYFQTVIIDPFTGIPIDFVGKNDCGVWNFQILVHYLTAFQPTGVYPVGDQHFNVNGVHHYLINNVC